MTCRLVASCCQSWGSMRFCAFRLVVASPRYDPISVVAPAGHRGRGRPFREHGRFPASSFIPFEGCSSPAADVRLRASLPPRTFFLRRSAAFSMLLLPASSFRSYRRESVPRGFAPQDSLYRRDAFEGVSSACPSWALVPFEVSFCSFQPTAASPYLPSLRVAPFRVSTGSLRSDAPASLGLCWCGDSPECAFTDDSSNHPPRSGLLSETSLDRTVRC